MSPLDIAIHRTFHDWPGGLKAAAAALGKAEQVLRNKASPTVTTNVLSLVEARDAMLMSGDLQILHALASELGVCVQGPLEGHASVMHELMTAEAEHGDVARVMADALRDNRITPREAADIAREVREEIAAKQRLLAAVEALAATGEAVFRA
jgi:hypothetical protein